MSKLFLIFVFYITLFISNYSLPQWITLNSGTGQNINAIQFINPQTGYAVGAAGTIIKTTNTGINWTSLNTGSSVEIRSVYFLNSSVGIVCGYNGTILKTNNGGNNWSIVNSGTTNHLFGISFYNDSVGICSGNSGTTLYSSNGGNTWLTGSPTGYMVTFYSSFMVNTTVGYSAGVNTIFSPLVAKTTNSGANWTYYSFMVNNNEATLRDVHFFDTQNGIAVSNLWNGQGGISRTTNGGVNWSSQIFTSGIFGIDFPNPLTGYCVGLNGLILKSGDGGNNWIQQSSGTTSLLNSVDFVDSINGFAVGNGGIILKTTNGGITSIINNSNNVPDKFYLYQNYPNPFNPSTIIRYEIPDLLSTRILGEDLVTLKVYDILGKEIETLVNERQMPGTYEATFNASRYPSGVYFYKLTTEGYSEAKKMILLR
ncbi:T9SS C-terminal target domain-containing protein [bacterium]|nr:MAG: T9SS C-terminal target domain-containing protein [bacterium]